MAEQLFPFDFVQGGGEVAVNQRSGQVRITAWDQPRAEVRATSSGALEDRIHVECDGRRLVVTIVGADSWLGFLGDSARIDLTIQVPRGTNCRVDSGSGAIEIAETAGAVSVDCGSGSVSVADVLQADVETGSGAVTVERSAGSVRAETGSGKLAVSDVRGRVDLSTGSGSLLVSRVTGPSLRAETGSGEVSMTQIDVAQLDVKASSGRVGVELIKIHAGGDYRVETNSGSVTVAVPPTANLQIHAESRNIRYEGLNVQVQRSERGDLYAQLNGGGARLEVLSQSKVELQPTLINGRAKAPHFEQAMAAAPALHRNEHMQKVVAMVAAGKLSPTEAEELLSALDDEEVTA
jgi:hypothetical protein